MIRSLEERDFSAVTEIVNESWKRVYAGYVGPSLLDEAGCRKRAEDLEKEFQSGRFQQYVWEEEGEAAGLLTLGEAGDEDKAGAFEVCRLYLDPKIQGRGIGSRCLAFAEEEARRQGCREVVIWAFQKNTRAIEFYQKNGYQKGRTRYQDAPYCAYGVRLEKTLLIEEDI